MKIDKRSKEYKDFLRGIRSIFKRATRNGIYAISKNPCCDHMMHSDLNSSGSEMYDAYKVYALIAPQAAKHEKESYYTKLRNEIMKGRR